MPSKFGKKALFRGSHFVTFIAGDHFDSSLSNLKLYSVRTIVMNYKKRYTRTIETCRLKILSCGVENTGSQSSRVGRGVWCQTLTTAFRPPHESTEYMERTIFYTCACTWKITTHLFVFFCSGADFCYIMNTSASTPIMVSICHASTARQISILIRIITAFTDYFFRTTLVFQVCGRIRKFTTSCARSLSFVPRGLKLCQQTVRRLDCPGLNRLAIKKVRYLALCTNLRRMFYFYS